MTTANTMIAAIANQASKAKKKLMAADDKEEFARIKPSSTSLTGGSGHG